MIKCSKMLGMNRMNSQILLLLKDPIFLSIIDKLGYIIPHIAKKFCFVVVWNE